MGGRGASSGISRTGKVYGSEYHAILTNDGKPLVVDNIKFIQSNDSKNNNKAPMETMTKDRIYVYVNGKNQIKSITWHDNKNMRNKTIEVDHFHIINGVKTKPHVHLGYEHAENGSRGLLPNEQKLLDKINNIWYNYQNQKVV